MWRGIRVRITALATVVVVAVLIVTAVALVTSQRSLLVDNLDETLRAQSADIAKTTGSSKPESPLVTRGDDDSIAQVVSPRGKVLGSTANFATRPALPPPPGDAKRDFRSTRLLAGEPQYRVLSRRVGDVVIHTATPLDDVEESLTALRLGLLVAIPVVATALAALIWWLVGWTLRPVEAMRREVADITGRNLDRRVPEPPTGDEIARLAHTMNAMLDRVEDAANRQQRFVADASHELRSPLTRIRSELEVDLVDPEAADLVATHRSVLEETESLQRLVDDLLLLARSDAADTRATNPVVVDLDDIVLRETERLRDTSSIHFDITGVSAAQIIGDPRELTRAVRNLTDNAVRHARSTVMIALTEQADHATLTVTDDGLGIAPAHRAQIFERFARLDEARTDTDGGTGLGLAITREIVERHGGTIVVEPHHSPGARFVVELPLAAPPDLTPR